MNRDDVLRIAREAGFLTGTRDYADGHGGMPFVQSVATGSFLVELERFAQLVRNAALEEAIGAVSKLADDVIATQPQQFALDVAADKIRSLKS